MKERDMAMKTQQEIDGFMRPVMQCLPRAMAMANVDQVRISELRDSLDGGFALNGLYELKSYLRSVMGCDEEVASHLVIDCVTLAHLI